MRLVIRTWNVFHGRTSPETRRVELARMVRLVTADGPDVVGLQEVPVWGLRKLEGWSGMEVTAAVTKPALAGPLAGLLQRLEPRVVRSPLTGQANAVLVARRHALVSAAVYRLNPGARSEPRLCQLVELRVNGRTLVLANVHATTRDGRSPRARSRLRARRRPRPGSRRRRLQPGRRGFGGILRAAAGDRPDPGSRPRAPRAARALARGAAADRRGRAPLRSRAGRSGGGRLVPLALDEIRAELPVLERVAYLNTGTFGPLPRATAATMAEQERRELEEGRSGRPCWEHARALRQRAREGVARLLGAEPEHVALTRSTTEGCNVVVAGLRLGPRDEIVTTDSEHFGLLGALAACGARVRVARVGTRPAAEALEAVEAEIGPRTRLIAISHVVWTTGQVMPVGELAGRGIPLLVDGAQGAGARAVDVCALGCDFYTVSGQKWLLGPDGTGALYVAPDAIGTLAISFPSYYSQKEFEPDGSFVATDGAPRFDTGTVPAPSVAGLLASLEFAAAVGPERHALALAAAQRCRQLLAERVGVVTEAGQSTLVSFVPPRDAAETVERLAASGVVVRELPGLGWVRASVGFWTSDDDLERLVEVL